MSMLFIALSGICQLIALSHMGSSITSPNQIAVTLKHSSIHISLRGLMIISVIFLIIAFIIELMEWMNKHVIKHDSKQKDAQIKQLELEIQRLKTTNKNTAESEN